MTLLWFLPQSNLVRYCSSQRYIYNVRMGRGWRFWLDSEPCPWSSPQQHISSRSFSLLLAVVLLPKHAFVFHVQRLYCTSLLFTVHELFSPFLLVKFLFAFRVIQRRSYQSSREQSAFYHLFWLPCWDRSSIYVSFPYIFLRLIWLTHSLYWLSSLFCPLVSLFIFFIAVSLPQGTH